MDGFIENNLNELEIVSFAIKKSLTNIRFSGIL
jgi:hypothetical protein